MSDEAPATPAPEASTPPADPKLPLVELDRALAPIRRLATWTTTDPGARASAVPYLEATVSRWVSAAKALELPEQVGALLDAQIQAVAGYDAADPDGRAQRLASLYQAVRRVDALMGLPLHGVPIRPPRKPRIPDWRVEEKPPAPEPPETLDPGDASEEAEWDDRPLVAKARKKRVKEQPPPPLPPFWNGRTSCPVEDLDLPDDQLEALANAGVAVVEDLLLLRPIETETLRPVHGAGRSIPPDTSRVAIGGRVMRRWTVLRPDGRHTSKVQLKGAGRVDAVWAADSVALAAAGGVEAYVPDARVILAGHLEGQEQSAELHEPERAFEDGAGGVRLRAYGIEGCDDRVLRGAIGRLLPSMNQVRDLLPGAELQRNGQESLRGLIPELHHRNEERARRRLAFDEALLLQTGLTLERYRTNRDRGLKLTPLHSLLAQLDTTHDLVLGDHQQAAFEDIKRDLRRKTPMRRVVTGPGGDGRALLGLLTVAAVAEGKIQVMVLCPDRLAAEQRYLHSVMPLKEGGLVVKLVEGKPSDAVRDGITRGEIHVIYGTHALLEADLEFRRLGLVVSEESENLGHASAEIARMKSPKPHALILPRVPVGPRIALTAYADHDVSILDVGAPAPKIGLVPASERSVVYGRAAEVVSAGLQAMVLFPVVKGVDALDIREAWRVVKALESDAFGKARMGLYHGSMSREERLRAHQDFCNRRLDVLVVTTAIEDAPVSAGASLIVLEQAERFEQGRQEQLRRYLDPARGHASIWCVHSGTEEEARERLGILLDPEPWDRRGTGLPEGTAGPQLPKTRWLDLDRDGDLLWRARATAHRVASNNPRLRSGWASDIARGLRTVWPSLYGESGPSLVLDDKRGPPTNGGRASQGRRRRRRRRKN